MTDRAPSGAHGPEAEAALAAFFTGEAEIVSWNVAVDGRKGAGAGRRAPGYTREDGFELSVTGALGEGVRPGASLR